MQRKDIRSTIFVMLSLTFATLTGFFRQTATASLLGSGRTADIYLIAFAIPEFFFIALPIVLTPVIIPFFSQIRRQRGEAAAWHWVSRLSKGLLILLSGIGVLCGLAAPLLIEWLSPGFTPSERMQAIQIFYRMLPGLAIMGISVLMGSFLQIYRRFALSVLTTAIYNLVFIASLLVLPLSNPLERAGWGVTLGAAAAVLFQIPQLLRIHPGETNRESEKILDQGEIRQAFQLTTWMAAGYGAHHIALFVDRAMATSLGTGSAAILNYGYHLALTVGQVSGLAVSTVIFPGLSEKINSQELEGARRSIEHGLSFVWGLALPASLGLVIFRIPIVQILLEHGEFLRDSTPDVGTAMAIYAFAVLADSMCQPLWRVIYAQRNGKMVLTINSVQTFIRVSGNLLLIPWLGYNGIAYSALAGLGLQVLILAILAAQSLKWKVSSASKSVFLKIMTAAMITFGIVSIFKTWLENSFIGISPVFILLTGGAVFIVMYVSIIYIALKFIQTGKDKPRGKKIIDFIN